MIRRGEIPEQWEDARRTLGEKLDAIHESLDHGFRAREQFRDVREVELRTSDLPVRVEVSGTAPPLSVLILAARSLEGDGAVYSGVGVSWRWTSDGKVQIDDFNTLPAGTRFAVTLALVE